MTTRKRRIPQRTCVICRDKTEKRRLTRLVRTNEGVFVDPTGKANGRGAYICDRSDCIQRAITSDALAKALRLGLTEADRQRIREIAS